MATICDCGDPYRSHVWENSIVAPWYCTLCECIRFRPREAGRSAEADVSPVAADQVQIPVPAFSRPEDNQSDARILAEDAACLARAAHLGDDGNGLALATLAQAKALASIALSMAFGGAK